MSAPTYAVIDQGNSRTKIGVFRDNALIHTISHAELNHESINALLKEHHVDAIMYSSVVTEAHETPAIQGAYRVIKFCPELKLPIVLGYRNNDTMGSDRIAAAAGLLTYTGPHRVAIDFGTCTTITILEQNTIINGSISPGRWMRYRALHEYTGRLPLVHPLEELTTTKAETTNETIHNGVSLASALEIEQLLHQLLNGKMPDSVVITGGDHPFFERHLKTPNFADPHLVLKGLHAILLENI